MRWAKMMESSILPVLALYNMKGMGTEVNGTIFESPLGS
jgi:hypothetical protein